MRLGNHQEQIKNFVLTSISEAQIEFTEVNSIGMYVSPINGWLSINVNNKSNLEQTNFNCPGFDNVEFKLLEIPEIEKEVNKEKPVFRYKNEKLNWAGEDEVLNRFVFKFILSSVIPQILVEFDKPLLLQMFDSKYLHTWNLETDIQIKPESANEILKKRIRVGKTKLYKWIKGLLKG